MRYNKITISGKICTGKSTLFRKLENELKWPTVETGKLFRQYAIQHGLNLEKAQEQNEELTKQVDLKVRNMLKNPKGHLLADSWLSGIMADSFPHVFRILLTSRDDIRFSRFAKREKIPLSEAKKRVNQRQKNWIDKVRKIYHREDFFDPKHYNLVIDTADLIPDEILKIVLKKMSD